MAEQMSCPACGSTDLEEDDTNPDGYECQHCGEQFWEDEAAE